MRIKNIPFNNLPFSSLFQSYSNNFAEVASFYETNPFDDNAVIQKADAFTYYGDRTNAAEILLQFNRQFQADSAAIENIDRLKNKNALAIVTGQQLGLYGGPVYTMLKAVTAIDRAKHFERMLGRPIIPVFWMADEDHDYEEIRSVTVLNGEGIETHALPKKKQAVPPVSDLKLPAELQSVRQKLQSSLIDTDFTEELWSLLNDCYSADSTFLEGFAHLMSRLFSRHGLVLAGSNNKAVKEETKEVLKTAVTKADSIRHALEAQTEELKNRFHQQVALNNSHLFYLDADAGRTKIYYQDNHWFTNGKHKWETDELLNAIDNNPASFSPDVLLRPVVQDRLLPTLGYVAGPGEIAYYGQMKSFYHCFDKKMPVIFPRISGTFIEPAIVRIFNELPFKIHEYNSRIEDLESAFVDRTQQLDIKTLFENWKKESEAASLSYRQEIKNIDETLEGTAKKIQAHFNNELDELKGKVYRAIKKRETTQLDRIRAHTASSFPGQKSTRANAERHLLYEQVWT